MPGEEAISYQDQSCARHSIYEQLVPGILHVAQRKQVDSQVQPNTRRGVKLSYSQASYSQDFTVPHGVALKSEEL